MTAGRLRAAAVLIRNRAELAEPGRWQVRIACSGLAIDALSDKGEVEVCPIMRDQNAEYIATMQPAVAEALAGLLFDLADRADEIASTIGSERVAASVIAGTLTGWESSVAVADLILLGAES